MKRNVIFFRVHIRKFDVETNTQAIVDLSGQRLADLLNEVILLPCQDIAPSRFYITEDGNKLYVEVDEENDVWIYGKLIVSRISQFPDLEINGVLEDLSETIPRGAGLAEKSHFILNKSTGCIGFESNFYGPRATAFTYYIPKKLDLVDTQIEVKPILNTDIATVISGIRHMSYLEMSVHRNQIDVLKAMDANIAIAFASARDANTDAEVIELKWKFKAHARKVFVWPFNSRNLSNMLTNAAQRGAFESIKLKSKEQGKVIDLLEDKFIFPVDFETEADDKGRIVSRSAYRSIQAVYRNVYPD